MNINIALSKAFKINAKRVAKKYNSFPVDIQKVIDQLLENPRLGTSLGNGLYKIRFAVQSKNKGKSGGARLITHVEATLILLEPEETVEVLLLTVYDKSEIDTIGMEELEEILTESLGQDE